LIGGAVTTTKVGIREFRAGLADYIDAEAPVAVTRHGQTVGYFIPTKRDPQADVAALRAAAAKLDALLDLDEAEVDAVVEDFRGSRRAKKKA
jgi:antitoxin (DNA-binding transcriptional repressor) of toxin-antitoxin stability system